ncbi:MULTISPECIES: LysR family transcriptional regulator [Rhizobium/Agrobacterium group]|uniref:LysR family transcriptional regulator n=1 Tax=Rhizobium/Agrobacterium group TaxID=227290 RepID=UPI000B0ED9AF|nr:MULTISPECIES: LysR family transcriptional regulator [unclassified Rhizobium]
MTMVNIRQIRSFQAVVELGNFSRAAERLGTSQASVSHAINDLETLLGARLFDRTTRRVELTEAGQIFAAGALAGLAEMDRSIEAVRDLSKLRAGLVRIAAPSLLAATVLPRLTMKMASVYPNLKLSIEDLGVDLIVNKVRNGLCDLGVGTFNSDEENIDSQHILSDRLLLFTWQEHEFRSREEVGWTDLQNQRIITLTRESKIRLLTEIGFESANLALRPYMEVHQIHTALSLVENQIGVAVLPTYAFSALNNRRIIARPLTDPAITRQVSIITARERAASPAAAAVRPLLRSVLREMVPEVL